jgi:hypothetical protein
LTSLFDFGYVPSRVHVVYLSYLVVNYFIPCLVFPSASSYQKFALVMFSFPTSLIHPKKPFRHTALSPGIKPIKEQGRSKGSFSLGNILPAARLPKIPAIPPFPNFCYIDDTPQVETHYWEPFNFPFPRVRIRHCMYGYPSRFAAPSMPDPNTRSPDSKNPSFYKKKETCTYKVRPPAN